jgi:protocatechuate 3,4-dioxygenase beta subunit
MEQSRKHFLKKMFIGAASVPMILNACSKETAASTGSGSVSGSGSGTGGSTCTPAPTETEGPFPTHTPSSFVRSDIRDDRTGVPLSIRITIQNTNNSCAALAGAVVDIWHCDKDGYYSEYGGSGMQSVNYTAVHFLRGRQTTDANGLVSFTSIFPGWYSGRTTHIHVHVYNAAGTSLKVTQIAFPEGSSSAVVLVNTTGTGYTKGMSGYTYNASDGVFSDDTAGVEIAAIEGSVSGGYTLTQIIKVAA